MKIIAGYMLALLLLNYLMIISSCGGDKKQTKNRYYENKNVFKEDLNTGHCDDGKQ